MKILLYCASEALQDEIRESLARLAPFDEVSSATGEIVWRRFTVPFPGEPGHETWEDDHDAWKTGGAGVWSHGTYDPETNLV